jgi:endonuclease YncB( thermonuclease family)
MTGHLHRRLTPDGVSMKYISKYIFLLLGLQFLPYHFIVTTNASEIIVDRASVIDDDTIEIHGRHIRLLAIHAPEKGQTCYSQSGESSHCGQAAANALPEFIDSQLINCLARNIDLYGRTVAMRLVNGNDIKEYLVRNGYAIAYKLYSSEYIEAENDARSYSNGI